MAAAQSWEGRTMLLIITAVVPVLFFILWLFHHPINVAVTRYYRKRRKKKTHRILNNNIYDMFYRNGEGLAYINIQSANNDIPAKLISLFSRGWVHSITVLYAENWDSWFSPAQRAMIQGKLNDYYHAADLNNIKVLVMGSADDSGMNFFDFSNYQDRKFTIRKTQVNAKAVINYICNTAYFPYDVTGLFFWLLRLFDDEKAFYCSEKVYMEWLVGGVKVAEHENPSPWDIEKYRRERIIYDSDWESVKDENPNGEAHHG